MHYELWDAKSANVIAVFRSEADGLGMVRQRLSAAWNAEHLSLGVDFDEGEDGDDAALPPVLYGTALARRARESGTGEAPYRA